MAERAAQERSKKRGAGAKRNVAHEAPRTRTKAVNPIKSKIRDVTRLLEHGEHLPAGVRIEKERALAGYKQDLEIAQREKQRAQMISKYHMVRFFERQKATRILKKLKTRAAASSSDSQELERCQKAVHEAEVDLNYTIYHPLMEKYLSLFPRSKAEGSVSPIRESAGGTSVANKTGKRPPMWDVIEQCMRANNLDALREGKLGSMYGSGQIFTVMEKQRNAQKSKQRERDKRTKLPDVGSASQEKGEESDGGFFEE